jgi:coenzyme Q-binding protein COQ10
MVAKVLLRKFFFEPEVITTSTKLSFNKSPVACYNLVADMGNYPTFIPWIMKSDVVDTGENTKDTTFDVGYPPFRQSYLSKVTLSYPHKIVSLSDNNKVFEFLESIWEFQPDPSELENNEEEILLTKCLSFYSLRFKFSSSIYQTFSSSVVDYIQTKTSEAFLEKAKTIEDGRCYYNKRSKEYRFSK